MPVTKQLSAGLELECTRLSVNALSLMDSNGFGRRTDSSIRDQNGNKLPPYGPDAPAELVTPILDIDASLANEGGTSIFSITSGDRLFRTIQDLTDCAAAVNSSCGLHIHLGRPNGEQTDWNPRRVQGQIGGPASEWKPGHVRTMLVIGLALENRLYDLVPESRKNCRHCRKIRELYSNTDLAAYYPVGIPVPRKQENAKRYCWLNLIETRRPADPAERRIGYSRSKAFGTIEIRLLGETKDPRYINLWVKFWLKIAAAVAYLPAEQAILQCCYSDWLQEDFDQLLRMKQLHERDVAPTCRSVMPTGPTNGEEDSN